MNQYKYLFKNIGLLTLSSFATKLLSFFLVPLYTNVLSTAEYGTYDLFSTTIGVLLPILTLNIQEGVLRFSLDKNYSHKSIVTVAAKYFLIANLMVIAGLALNAVLGLSIMVKQYTLFFFLMFLSQSLSGIVTMYIRGIDRITDLSVSSVIASLFTIASNILFLVVFKFGLIGYFLANIIGPLMQCVYLLFRAHVFRDLKLRERFPEEKKAMTAYSKPLIANSLAWWVNSASDRYIVVFFCGLAENGIYSVASKIPSILNIFQTIFNQAWTLSAVRDYDPEDKNGFFSNTYRAYNCMMVIICSMIIVLDKLMAGFLYAKDFYVAWKYVPWLTIAILFGAMSGYLGGFFSAVKDSKIFARSTMMGAMTNVILNLVFTPFIGALGAAIATTACYFEVYIYRYVQSRKYIKLRINLKRDLLSYLLLVVQGAALLVIRGTLLTYVVEAGIFLVILLLYIPEISMVADKCLKRLGKRK